MHGPELQKKVITVPQPYIDFAYVKQHASFERVIAGYNLRLFGTGAQRSLLCPFHRERTPSCKIDLERNIWHCFGCGAKGNILEFVARLEGDEDDLRAAAVKIADICGIATAAPRERAGAAAPAGEHRRAGARAQNGTGSSRRTRVARTWTETDKSTPERSAPAPHQQSARPDSATVRLTNRQLHGVAKEKGGRLTRRPADGVAEPVDPPLTFQLKLDPAHPYLAERGLSAEVIAEFGLGYCSRGSMAGRVCIPIHNERGELVAYAGRWPGDDDIPEGEDRYKLPAKFQKSRILFNLHRVSDAEHVVLVEGFWSVFRLHAMGVPVAALMGNSVSQPQIALLRERGTRRVTLLLDGDDAGGAARGRALPALASTFFVHAPLLPDGQKPDTLPERALRALLNFD